MLAAGSRSWASPAASDETGKSVFSQRGDGPAHPQYRYRRQTHAGHPDPGSSGYTPGRGPFRAPPRRERQARQQRQGIDEVRGKRVGARNGGVPGHVLEQHERRANERFGRQEHHREGGAEPHRILARKSAPRPDHQHRHQRQVQSAGDPVREFDDGGRARRSAASPLHCTAASGYRNPPPSRWPARMRPTTRLPGCRPAQPRRSG